MSLTCPNCSAPMEDIATTAGGSRNSIHCARCGFDSDRASREVPHPLTNPGDSEPIAAGETVITPQMADQSEEIAPTEVPDTVPSDQQRHVGHFRLIRELGKGAFGTVWLAEDTNLSRRVALKLPGPDEKDARLLHEAKTAARLKHPNIVSIYEVGEHDGQQFIASEMIDGRTLLDEMLSGRLEVSRAVEVLANIARAAHYAHEMGIIHRDLKPSNVMIDGEGAPHITDFGIAKSLRDDVTVAGDGTIIGTVAYMAPEQARGESSQTDCRSDIYALGVILFEMLTEYRPFRGSAEGVLRQKTRKDPPSPRTLVPAISRDLEIVCLKCLERDSENRYRTALEVAEELDRIRQGAPVRARPVSRLEKSGRWMRRNPQITTLSAALLVAILGGLAMTTRLAYVASSHAEGTEEALYRARMVLAADSWINGDIDRMNQLLGHYALPSDDSAHRDFAWHHFSHLGRMFPHVVHHGTRVDDVAITRDGTAFATTGLGGRIRIWNTSDGTELRTLGTGDVEFRCVTFSTTDNRLVAGGNDGLIRVWNPTQHGRLAFNLTHGGEVSDVAVSPDGQYIASAGKTGIIKLWDFPTRMQVNESLFRTADVEGREVHSIQYSPDGRRLAVVYTTAPRPGIRPQRQIVVIDAVTGAVDFQGTRRQQISGVTFTHDSQQVLASTRNGILQRIDLTEGSVNSMRPRVGIFGELANVEVEGQSYTLLTQLSGVLSVLDVDMQVVNDVVTHRQTFGLLDVSEETGLAVAGSGDGTARIISLSSLRMPSVGWRPSIVRSVCFATDDASVTIAESDGSVSVWDPVTGTFSELIAATRPPRPVLSVAANAYDGTISCCGMMRELRVAEFESGTMVGEVQLPPGGHSSVAISGDGTLIACGGRGGTISVFRSSVLNDRVTKHVRTDIAVNEIDFAPEGNMLVAAYEDGHFVILSPEVGVIGEWESLSDDAPRCLSISPDGMRIAVGTRSGSIQIYSLPSGNLIRETKSHAGQINQMDWFPDGQLLVSGGQDAEVRVWDADSGALVTRLVGHEHQVFSLDVSADGRSIVSCSSDGDVRLWRSQAE